MAEAGQGWYELLRAPLRLQLYPTFLIAKLQLTCIFLTWEQNMYSLELHSLEYYWELSC